MNAFSNVPIDFDSIPRAEEISFTPIEKKYLIVQILGDIIIWLVLIIISSGIRFFPTDQFSFIKDYYPIILGVLIFLLILTVIMDVLGFRWKGYIIRERDIIYRSGLIFRKITHVPFNRIQHCEVNQSLLDRYVNLAKLKVFTAGGGKSDLVIPGLTNENATDYKSFILKKTGEND